MDKVARRRGGGAREEDVSGLAGTQSRGAQLVPNSRYRHIALPAQSLLPGPRRPSSAASSALGGGTRDRKRRTWVAEKVSVQARTETRRDAQKGNNRKAETSSREAPRVARSRRVGAALIDRTITANGQRPTPPGGIPLFARFQGGVVELKKGINRTERLPVFLPVYLRLVRVEHRPSEDASPPPSFIKNPKYI